MADEEDVAASFGEQMNGQEIAVGQRRDVGWVEGLIRTRRMEHGRDPERREQIEEHERVLAERAENRRTGWPECLRDDSLRLLRLRHAMMMAPRIAPAAAA